MSFASAFASACALALCVFVAPACSSSDSPPDFEDPDVAAVPTNPDGVPYPTDRLGGLERKGTIPGSRIPNFAFQGYRDGDRAAGLTTISMSEYFDPDQKRHKVLHLILAATWCAICSSELEAAVSAKEPLAGEGVALLEVIVSGATAGKGPALSEVDEWVDRHHSTLTTAIDVRARRVGALGVSPSVMPHDILIDTRTMEILDSSTGAPADIVRYDRDGLKWVAENPPSY